MIIDTYMLVAILGLCVTNCTVLALFGIESFRVPKVKLVKKQPEDAPQPPKGPKCPECNQVGTHLEKCTLNNASVKPIVDASLHDKRSKAAQIRWAKQKGEQLNVNAVQA